MRVLRVLIALVNFHILLREKFVKNGKSYYDNNILTSTLTSTYFTHRIERRTCSSFRRMA